MKIVAVNIGQARTHLKGQVLETTGIYKLPTPHSVRVSELGVQGDSVCDHKYHGGPDQAVYIYGAPDYAWWSQELGQAIGPGTFGDNLTISDLVSAEFNIGDRLHIGSVVLEVTAPRLPCATLAARMGDPQFVKRYRHAERPGLYCRVIQAGSVQVGDKVRVERYAGEAVLAIEIFRDHYRRKKDKAVLQRFLSVPIAVRTRREIERDLAKFAETS